MYGLAFYIGTFGSPLRKVVPVGTTFLEYWVKLPFLTGTEGKDWNMEAGELASGTRREEM